MMNRWRLGGWRLLLVVVMVVVGASILAPTSDAQPPDDSGGAVNFIPGFVSVRASTVVNPTGIDIDPETGFLWVASASTDSAFVFSHDGNPVDEVGDTGSGSGELDGPGGVSILNGEVFIADPGNGRVQVFGTDGNFLRTIGAGLVSTPCALEAAGDFLYVQDDLDSIAVFTISGTFVTAFDGSASGTTFSLGCTDTIAAVGDEIYVADTGNMRVMIFDSDAVWQGSFPVAYSPYGIDVDGVGQVWLTHWFGADVVMLYTTAGAFVAELNQSGTALGQLARPVPIVADPSGDTFWVGEVISNRVQVFSRLRCDGQFLTHVGTSYDDTINTLPNADVINLGPGDDLARVRGGDDTVCGGEGDDDLRGSGGNDWLDGGPGDDIISGGGGLDEIFGRDGADQLDGQGAADMLFGGDGADVINGQNGGDLLRGGDGNDIMRAQTGPDTLEGQAGDDDMRGGNGNDTLRGGAGVDICSGNTGGNDQAQAATCESTPGVEVLF